MAYDKTQPLITNTGVEARTAIENNFDAISDFVEVDHVEFNGADQGKHNSMTMPEQAVAPTPQANEGALYCKESPSTATTALFFRNESSGDEVEVTGAKKAVDGWAYLPSGLIMMWGGAVVGQGSDATATFVTGSGIPTLSKVYSVQVTISGDSTNDGTIFWKSNTLLDITVHNTATAGSSQAFTYLIIGD